MDLVFLPCLYQLPSKEPSSADLVLVDARMVVLVDAGRCFFRCKPAGSTKRVIGRGWTSRSWGERHPLAGEGLSSSDIAHSFSRSSGSDVIILTQRTVFIESITISIFGVYCKSTGPIIMIGAGESQAAEGHTFLP
jgi:hypothetical protein